MTFTLSEIKKTVRAIKRLRNVDGADRSYRYLKKVAKSFEDSLLLRYGLSEDEVPF